MELNKKIKKTLETKADAWKRIEQDDEMKTLADSGLVDFKNIITEYEATGLPKQKKPTFGFLKGQFKMAADFDAPLEDFKEYM